MSAHLEPIGFGTQDGSTMPLVLIHDGGGTIFQYCLVRPFSRPVYAIANPYFDEGGKPEGGIPQLAQEYARAIQRDIGKGSVLLGGWSFGGTLSVEVARQLRSSGEVQVRGLLMIDSMCPWSDNYRARGRVRPTYRPSTPDMVRVKVNRSFDNARDMMLEWERPSEYEAPPAVMVGASQRIPAQNCADGLPVTGIPDAQLGWSEYPCLDFVCIKKVPGDHFSMFADDKAMTDTIEDSCVLLESQGQGHDIEGPPKSAAWEVRCESAPRSHEPMVELVA